MDTEIDPVQSGSKIIAFIVGFPAAQALSMTVILAWVALSIMTMIGKVIDPTYQSTLVWMTGASVLHQGYKLYKGGQAEVDSQ